MNNYRLVKEMGYVFPGKEKIEHIIPQNLGLTEHCDYYTVSTKDVKCYFSEEFIGNNPEYFEKVIDWSKEKYFRNGYVSELIINGKIYKITGVVGNCVYYIDDEGGEAWFKTGSNVEANATPATEAEFLEQQKAGKKEKLIEKYEKLISNNKPHAYEEELSRVWSAGFIPKSESIKLLKQAIEEAMK